MITVKLSYSILRAWENKRYEDAVSMYLGRPMPEVAYLELGKAYHQKWALYTQRTAKLHPNLGGTAVTNPVVEQKLEKLLPFSERYQILLRGIPDLVCDHPDGRPGLLYYEYKCGFRTATGYVDELQGDYMKLLVPKMREVRYVCFNPYLKTRTVGLKFLTNNNADTAYEHILTYGGEMIDYLRSQKLLVNYKQRANEKSDRPISAR